MSMPPLPPIEDLAAMATEPLPEWLADDGWVDYDYRTPPLKIIGTRKIKYKLIGKIPPRTLRDDEWEKDT